MSRLDDPATDYIERLSHQALEGEVDPIRAYIRIYEIEKIAGEYRKQILDLAIEKREQIGGKTYSQEGYEIAVQTRKTWTYKGDEEYDRLAILLKNRQALMQKAHASASKGLDFADDNGILVEPATPKFSTSLVLKAK